MSETFETVRLAADVVALAQHHGQTYERLAR